MPHGLAGKNQTRKARQDHPRLLARVGASACSCARFAIQRTLMHGEEHLLDRQRR
jgi:hypothetical protein